MRILLVDLSTYFSTSDSVREYNVLEPPLGLMALLTHLNSKENSDMINGKIIKSRIDFENLEELLTIVNDFQPNLIGFRAMTFYRKFFHDTVAYLRKNKINLPIIVGGPYPTASWRELLEDKNVDLAVIAEGELTLEEIANKMIANNCELPPWHELNKVNGIAFHSDKLL